MAAELALCARLSAELDQRMDALRKAIENDGTPEDTLEKAANEHA